MSILRLGLILVFPALLHAQTGGTRIYRFLDIPATARAASSGGSNMSIWGDDINLVHSNPSLLNRTMGKQAAFNYCSFVGDMNLYYAAYAHDMGKSGVAAIGLQGFSYGGFEQYDEFGQRDGNFRASDYSINLHYAKPFADTSFNIGVSLKTMISQYETYSSAGSALDFGITWRLKSQVVMSLLVRNVGFVWKDYAGQQGAGLPADVQFGMSKKVPKAPFRLFFVYNQLLKWNVSYLSPVDTAGNLTSFGSSESRDSTGWQRFSAKAGSLGGNFLRHFVVGTEIVFSRNFHITLAYNFRRQSELAIPERRGINGLSVGFSMRIKRFGFAYSFSKMAFPGNSSIFGLTFAW